MIKIREDKETQSSGDCSTGQPSWDWGVERGGHYKIGGLRFLGEFPSPPSGRATCVLVGQGKWRSDGHTGCQCAKSGKEPQPLPGERSIPACSAGYSGPWRHPACLPTLVFRGAAGFFVEGSAGDLLWQGCPGAIRHGCPYIKNAYCGFGLYFSVIKGRINN